MRRRMCVERRVGNTGVKREVVGKKMEIGECANKKRLTGRRR